MRPLLLILYLAFAGPALADSPETDDAAEPASTHDYFPDSPLIDQHGESHRFYADLMQGRTVVIAPIHGDCTTTVPQMLQNLEAIGAAFDARMDKELRFLLITVDPGTDGPNQLQGLAGTHLAGSGWLFLGGEPGDVEHVQRKLGQWPERPDAHSTIFMVGNDRTGLWIKVHGLSDAAELIDAVRSVLDDELPSTDNDGGTPNASPP